jgi:hydroxyacylglutathione hydrolase
MLKTFKLQIGPFGTNCYLAWDSESRQGVVIDPGSEPERIIGTIRKQNLQIVKILNTHGHGDHIGANLELKEFTRAPLLIHRADAPMLTDPELNYSTAFGMPVTSPREDGYLAAGEKISFGGLALEVLVTPGHTPGGVCLYGEGVVFTGDTLFCGSMGRCDLPGGDERLLVRSIRKTLFALPEETLVFPGHGPETAIGTEKTCNPYLI